MLMSCVEFGNVYVGLKINVKVGVGVLNLSKEGYL